MSSYLNFALVTLCILICLHSPSSGASPPLRPFNKVYAFGDSYTDTGNNLNRTTRPLTYQHADCLPYGSTFFHRPTGRYTNGRLFIDFILESLNLPFLPPYANKSADTTHGVNFAVAGCSVIPQSFYLKNNLTVDKVPPSLPTQLTWFKDDHIKGSGCKDAVSTPAACKAVFNGALVWFGEIATNDYNYITGSLITSNTVQKLSIKYQTKAIEALLRMGAKYFVVQGLQATGCFSMSFILTPIPQLDDIGCVAYKNKESYDHNMALQARLHKVRIKFPSAVIVYGDDWHAYREIYSNAGKYGFVERFKVCCGSGDNPYNFSIDTRMACGAPGVPSCKHPSRYMNWDGIHLTEGLLRVSSRMFIDGKFADPPFPYLLKKATEEYGA